MFNVGRGGAAPPAPPLLAGRWPAESLERFAFSVAFILSLGGGALPPHTPPAGRPSAGGESRALRPFGRLILIINDNNRMMLGGGALPPLHPPCWPAFGRRGISSASPFRSQ